MELAQPVRAAPGGCPTPWRPDFCAEALEEALTKGQPEVFNTDQGSQFTSLEFTQVLQEHGVKIHGREPGGTRTTSSWSACGGR